MALSGSLVQCMPVGRLVIKRIRNSDKVAPAKPDHVPSNLPSCHLGPWIKGLLRVVAKRWFKFRGGR